MTTWWTSLWYVFLSLSIHPAEASYRCGRDRPSPRTRMPCRSLPSNTLPRSPSSLKPTSCGPQSTGIRPPRRRLGIPAPVSSKYPTSTYKTQHPPRFSLFRPPPSSRPLCLSAHPPPTPPQTRTKIPRCPRLPRTATACAPCSTTNTRALRLRRGSRASRWAPASTANSAGCASKATTRTSTDHLLCCFLLLSRTSILCTIASVSICYAHTILALWPSPSSPIALLPHRIAYCT